MSTQNIYPKPCVYNCNIQIYWNATTSEYWDVFTKKKHICPNRSNNTKQTTSNTNTPTTKPTYYNKKPWNSQHKPKMSNSFELLQGSITEIQNKYEILSDIVSEYNGKVMVRKEIEIQRLVSLTSWYIMKFQKVKERK